MATLLDIAHYNVDLVYRKAKTETRLSENCSQELDRSVVLACSMSSYDMAIRPMHGSKRSACITTNNTHWCE